MKVKIYMVVFNLTLAFVFLSYFSFPQGDQQQKSELGDDFEKSFKFLPGGKININALPAGNVALLGWDKGIVKINAKKRVSSPTVGQVDDLSNGLTIKVKANEVDASIQTVCALPQNLKPRIDYTIYIPAAKTDLNLVAGQGSITVREVNGSIGIRGISGNINLIDLKGSASAFTNLGDVLISLSGSGWEGSQLSSSTGQGNITIEIPKDYSATLYANARKGKIQVDYPPQIIDGEEVILRPTTKKRSSWLVSMLGGGGAPIRINSGLGNIAILLRGTTAKLENERIGK